MSQVKLTKNELRTQQVKLTQLKKYLPTLQLKKALLQVEVNQVEVAIQALGQKVRAQKASLEESAALFSAPEMPTLFESIEILDVQRKYENIAGVDCPIFESVQFAPLSYSLFESPLWMDMAVEQSKALLSLREEGKVMEEKKRALEKELRDVSIRVNLFEKVMIPRTQGNIKKIKVFLGDQQLASVAQAKVAKQKIEMRKLHDH